MILGAAVLDKDYSQVVQGARSLVLLINSLCYNKSAPVTAGTLRV